MQLKPKSPKMYIDKSAQKKPTVEWQHCREQEEGHWERMKRRRQRKWRQLHAAPASTITQQQQRERQREQKKDA
ncbi:hypothetical protein M5D96_012807, partial [Drosophila gunungcola]